MCDKVHCEECGKLLGYANYETFHKSYKGFVSKGYRKLFCNEQCYKQYCNKNKIEVE
jgi:hypothetical protein